MAFILSKQRHEDSEKAFQKYNKYLYENKNNFPPVAFELATSDWYYGFDDHRAPHDSWLEELIISEKSSGKRHEIRHISIKIILLGAYHDGYIEFSYPKVFRYAINSGQSNQGHGDWRYDEFRLSDSGNLIHEIEWAGDDPPGNWIIEAADIHFKWNKKKNLT